MTPMSGRGPELIRTGRSERLPSAWEITEDNGDGTFDLQQCYDDDSLVTGATIDSVLPLDAAEHLVEERVVLCVLADGTVRFLAGAGLPVHDATPDVTVGTTAETEAAQTDDWDVGDGTLKVTQQTRTAYSDTGDETLYAYYRDFYYTADGRLTRVSAETRVTIDAPEACP